MSCKKSLVREKNQPRVETGFNLPHLCDTATGSIRIPADMERQLKEYAKGCGQQLPPVRSKQDLALALVSALVGKNLNEVIKECSED